MTFLFFVKVHVTSDYIRVSITILYIIWLLTMYASNIIHFPMGFFEFLQ